MATPKIHIGTSGWSYKEWKGVFYPASLKSTEWLAYYARSFPITEINSSFYHLPLKKTVESWARNTPDNFLFCPKMSRYLTHLKQLKEGEEALDRFFSVFEPLREKMGPILFQLPASLVFDAPTAEGLFDLLKNKYNGYSFSLEGRHPTWQNTEALELLRLYEIAFVIAESGGRFPYTEHFSAKNSYIRFHGPDGRYNLPYPEEELERFARLFAGWLGEGHELWIFFNNTFYGDAIQNARQLEELLKKQLIP